MGAALAHGTLTGSYDRRHGRRPTTVGAMSKPLGPYTPAVRAGDFVFVSGQLGMADGRLASGVAAQTEQAIANLAGQLERMGASLGDVVKTTCFLVDMDSFATFNEAYVGGFGSHRPARSTIAVRELPANAVVEIEAVAYQPLG
jgi:2-iminobutanoate/2-iminopropanoate deaminase